MGASKSKRIIACICSFTIVLSLFSNLTFAYALSLDEIIGDVYEIFLERKANASYGVQLPDLTFSLVEGGPSVTVGGLEWASNMPQKYYTTPTSSTEDKYGNVTNYYRGGDTTTTKILDSYNQTFNTIHNTTNNNNNYRANVKLSDFLNTYTTVNNDYTYNTEYKSWYYDNTQNTLNYDASQTYYNNDYSQYYISIDNSTDEYYLVDVQYSPTFVTVNYTYNNIDNSTNYGDVTNVYYFELTDGRNSSSLSASEVAGMDLGYDVVNYDLISDDLNTLSLQHFDGDYLDSSSYSREFYSENRSTSYVDSGEFGKALKLSSGSAAGVVIPNLSDNESLSFDFRIYYNSISSFGIFLGDVNLFSPIPRYRSWNYYQYYADSGDRVSLYFEDFNAALNYTDAERLQYGSTVAGSAVPYVFSNELGSTSGVIPVDWNSSGFTQIGSDLYGVYQVPDSNFVESISSKKSLANTSYVGRDYDTQWSIYSGNLSHFDCRSFKLDVTNYVAADFEHSAYVNQWVSMRIAIKDGKIYYFFNGDLVGSGNFTMPVADKFYIKSSGTIYLDELRVSTGDMVSVDSYNPSSVPYDTNKVLALPDELAPDSIYVRHSTPVTAWRIGGVRPSNPSVGFLYIPLHSDYTGAQAQFFDGSNWVDVEAYVSDGSTTTNTLGFTFNPVSQSPDVSLDAKPGGSDTGSSLNCVHTWLQIDRTDATCTSPGLVNYQCSKCENTKSDVLPMVSHSWTIKQTVPTTYDDSGNIVTEGYTIYRCGICLEEYKDSNGSGPPLVDSNGDSGSSGDGDSDWFKDLMRKIGDFFGTTVGGFLELIGTAISKVLDSLISLVSLAVEKLTEVLDLFGTFGQALSVLWSWLPEEVVTVLVAGVTVIIFASVIKLFVR